MSKDFKEKKMGKNSSRRPNRRPQKARGSKSEAKPVEGEVKSSNNDPIWYLFNGTVVSDAASISYSNPMGIPIQECTFNGETHKNTIPSLLAIYFSPTLGDTKNGITAPVNIQTRAIMTKCQSNVSVKLPFAASDIAVHFGAVDSLYIMYEFCARLYGLYRTYAAMDRTMPEIYYRAMGLDPNNMEQHMSMISFKHKLNKIGTDIARLFIPKGLAIFDRHKWMCQNIFLDSPSIKAQQYMFVPRGLWKFVPEGSTGGELEYVPMPSFQYTGLKGVMDYFDLLLDPVINDLDMWTMNGYMLRTYGSENCRETSLINDDYKVVPVFNAEVLPQIHNMDVAGPFISNQRIQQNENDCVVWVPKTEPVYHGDISIGTYGKILIDMPFDAPTPVDNLLATRLKISGYVGDSHFDIYTWGTEIVNSLRILSGAYGNVQDIDINTLAIPANWTDDSVELAPEYVLYILEPVAKLSHFNMSPMYKLTNDVKDDLESSTSVWYDVISDLTNYTTIGYDELAKLHDAAVMGEWFIPSDMVMNVK